MGSLLSLEPIHNQLRAARFEQPAARLPRLIAVDQLDQICG
jgi:hypothetical protein